MNASNWLKKIVHDAPQLNESIEPDNCGSRIEWPGAGAYLKLDWSGDVGLIEIIGVAPGFCVVVPKLIDPKFAADMLRRLAVLCDGVDGLIQLPDPDESTFHRVVSRTGMP